jgi:hypothetical protein
MAFIEKYWKPNHILAKDSDFFDYEHVYKDRINFFVARSLDTNKILAIQGFIPYGSYPDCHICGVISRVHPDSRIPMLGVELMKKMLEITKPTTYCGIGTNPKTMIPLVKRFFKRSTGIMDHYYILNPSTESYKIAKINNRPRHLISATRNNLNKFYSILATKNDIKEVLNNLVIDDRLPKKSYEYIIKRYFKNPKYNYKCYKMNINEGLESSLLFTREVFFNDAKALRIIDFIGNIDILAFIGQWALSEIKAHNYEYIDLLSSGIDKEILIKSGFVKSYSDSKNVIPTYFEPFIRENIDIFYEKSEENLILFKGDADGDRPNQMS